MLGLKILYLHFINRFSGVNAITLWFDHSPSRSRHLAALRADSQLEKAARRRVPSDPWLGGNGLCASLGDLLVI
jgi:hypothetical protein